jgi:hypothetical protein
MMASSSTIRISKIGMIFGRFALGYLALTLAACSPSAPISSVITRDGAYPSPTGVHSLNVSVDAKKVVHFEVVDRVSKTVVASGKSGSIYQRWFFFWESDSRLWVQSSDVGLFAVWDLTGGKASEHRIEKGDSVLRSVPPPVVSALSNTMRKRFGL